MPTLQPRLLGALDVRRDDQPLPRPPTLKSQSLLAYLATRCRRQPSRERLCDLFGRDRPERKTCSPLPTALWQIRRCFPDRESIPSDPHSVPFDPACDLWLDARRRHDLPAQTTPLHAELLDALMVVLEGRHDRAALT